jgi:hypothetical protein
MTHGNKPHQPPSKEQLKERKPIYIQSKYFGRICVGYGPR